MIVKALSYFRQMNLNQGFDKDKIGQRQAKSKHYEKRKSET